MCRCFRISTRRSRGSTVSSLVRWVATISPMMAMGALYAYWGSVLWAIIGGLFWPFTLGYIIVKHYVRP